MSIYDVTYSQIATQTADPSKRGNIFTRWYKAFLSPIQRDRDLYFGDYRTGSTAPLWSAGTYAQYARVIYNKVVYESLINGNTDTPPSANWMIVQNNFIGLSERIMYTGQTITLTYALNKWFNTVSHPLVFRQPNQKVVSQVARASNVATITVTGHGYSTNDIVSVIGLSTADFNGVYKITVTGANSFTYSNTGGNVSTTSDAGLSSHLSDIYILTQGNPISIFRSTTVEANSSKVKTTGSTEYVFTTYNFSTLINFSIYFPVAAWTALAGNTTDRNNIVNNFVSQYVPAGLVWSVVTY
jgi:hypothetical protein